MGGLIISNIKSVEALFLESYGRWIGIIVGMILLLGFWRQDLIFFSMHFLLLGLLLGVPICAFSSVGVRKQG